MSLAVDVAIVAYGRWDLTQSCLDHLANQTATHRVTLCVNGRDDGTAARSADEFPDVRVVPLDQRMPFSVACNAAVAAGDGGIVVIMNNDVDAPPSFLERLIAPLAEDESVGSVTSLMVRPGADTIDSVGLAADPTLAGYARLRGHPRSMASAERPTLCGPAGTAAAFRRAAWDQMGGLDENILAYHEDLDLALRLRAAGWKTVVATDAIAVHLGSATFRQNKSDQRWRAGFGRGYVLRRYGILSSRLAPRAITAEAIAVGGDLIMSRDLSALRGRMAGWRAAAGLPRHPYPPCDAIDRSIGLVRSLRLRLDA